MLIIFAMEQREFGIHGMHVLMRQPYGPARKECYNVQTQKGNGTFEKQFIVRSSQFTALRHLPQTTSPDAQPRLPDQSTH
jgi:hypothetical protein